MLWAYHINLVRRTGQTVLIMLRLRTWIPWKCPELSVEWWLTWSLSVLVILSFFLCQNNDHPYIYSVLYVRIQITIEETGPSYDSAAESVTDYDSRIGTDRWVFGSGHYRGMPTEVVRTAVKTWDSGQSRSFGDDYDSRDNYRQNDSGLL